MKKTFAILASLVILGSSAVSQAATGPVSIAGIAPDYSAGAVATSTGAPVMDSHGQPVSTSADTQRLNSAAYILLSTESRCRIAWRSLLTGYTGHGDWFDSGKRSMLEGVVEDHNRIHAGEIVHSLECE